MPAGVILAGASIDPDQSPETKSSAVNWTPREALARRARISLDAPVVPVLGESQAVRLGLTSREAEVLALVAAGKTNREIGAQLYVSEKIASVHVSNILRKLRVSSRVDAAAIAQRVGVV